VLPAMSKSRPNKSQGNAKSGYNEQKNEWNIPLCGERQVKILPIDAIIAFSTILPNWHPLQNMPLST